MGRFWTFKLWNLEVMNLPLTVPRSSTASPPTGVQSGFQPSREGLTEFASQRAIAELESRLDNCLLLTDKGNILYASDNLQALMPQLLSPAKALEKAPVMSLELVLICQTLKQARSHFPHQSWKIDCTIFTKQGHSLQVRARWVNLTQCEQPCILMLIENSQQIVQDLLCAEIKDWGLTSREQEVYLLHQEGKSYGQVAEQLCITLNTVKKHMRNIHAKHRAVCD